MKHSLTPVMKRLLFVICFFFFSIRPTQAQINNIGIPDEFHYLDHINSSYEYNYTDMVFYTDPYVSYYLQVSVAGQMYGRNILCWNTDASVGVKGQIDLPKVNSSDAFKVSDILLCQASNGQIVCYILGSFTNSTFPVGGARCRMYVAVWNGSSFTFTNSSGYNITTGSYSWNPKIDYDGNGNMIIAWWQSITAGSNYIYSRRMQWASTSPFFSFGTSFDATAYFSNSSGMSFTDDDFDVCFNDNPTSYVTYIVNFKNSTNCFLTTYQTQASNLTGGTTTVIDSYPLADARISSPVISTLFQTDSKIVYGKDFCSAYEVHDLINSKNYIKAVIKKGDIVASPVILNSFSTESNCSNTRPRIGAGVWEYFVVWDYFDCAGLIPGSDASNETLGRSIDRDGNIPAGGTTSTWPYDYIYINETVPKSQTSIDISKTNSLSGIFGYSFISDERPCGIGECTPPFPAYDSYLGYKTAQPFIYRQHVGKIPDEKGNECTAILFPNPARENCTLAIKTDLKSVIIFDGKGAVILTKDNINNHLFSFSVRNWTKGLYLIRYFDGKTWGYRNLVVQ